MGKNKKSDNGQRGKGKDTIKECDFMPNKNRFEILGKLKEGEEG